MHRFAVFFIVPSSNPTVTPTERTAKTISTEKVSSTEVKKPVGTPRKSVARPRKGNINVCVAVNFLFQLIFVFPLFFAMVMNLKQRKTKLNCNICDNEQLFSEAKKDVMNSKDRAGRYFSCRFSSKSRH